MTCCSQGCFRRTGCVEVCCCLGLVNGGVTKVGKWWYVLSIGWLVEGCFQNVFGGVFLSWCGFCQEVSVMVWLLLRSGVGGGVFLSKVGGWWCSGEIWYFVAQRSVDGGGVVLLVGGFFFGVGLRWCETNSGVLWTCFITNGWWWNVGRVRNGESVQTDVMTNVNTPFCLRRKGRAEVYACAVVIQ